MTMTLTAPAAPVSTSTVPVIPESAPFTSAQRAWLNGFFAGMLGLDRSGGNGAAVNGAVGRFLPLPGPVGSSTPPAQAPAAGEEVPWHDPPVSVEKAPELAEGQP